MLSFPENGRSVAEILAQLESFKSEDVNWRGGKNFAYVYYAGKAELHLAQKAYATYFSENGLNPTAFPSLQRMEKEVLQMVKSLLHAPSTAEGSLTSGGTESILMAVKTARAWFFQQNSSELQPEVLIPETAHPAFHKACYYFGLTPIIIPVDAEFKAVPSAFEAAINEKTALIVASAPSYPQGIIDPIEEIGKIAEKHNCLFHVDACVGGFILPFLQANNPAIPDFDFRIQGVTSMSADIHKYGFAAKGASTILYRTAALRKAQFYVYTDWTGGIYASPALTGTRPGGAIAAAWAILNFMGRAGYLEKAMQTISTANRIKEAIRKNPRLKLLGHPQATLMAVASDHLDIYELGDELGQQGWYIDRQQLPPSLHLTITPAHAAVVDEFLRDLELATEKAARFRVHKLGKYTQLGVIKGLQFVLPKSLFNKLQQTASKYIKVGGGGRSAAMYGMMGSLQGKGQLDDLVKSFLHRLHQSGDS